MDIIQKAIRNIGLYGISLVINSLLAFVLSIYLARCLGEIEYGKYSFALSFASFFVIFADFGINQLIVKDLARNKELVSNYIRNLLFLKSALSLLTFGIIILLIHIMNYPEDTTFAVYFFGIYIIFNTFSRAFISILQAFERIEYISIFMVVEQLILTLLIAYVLLKGYGLITVAFIYAFAGAIGLVLVVNIVLRKIARPGPSIDLSLWKTLVINGLPFALNALFAALFFKIDTVMLSLLKGDYAVGIYNAAYNPLLTLSFILSGMIVAVLYPMMSRYFVSSKESLEIITITSIRYIAIIGFPIAVGCIILAKRFIEIFYSGMYLDSIIAFQILALFIPLRLVSNLTGTLLTSIDSQRLRTAAVCFAAIFNIILNVLLIPYFTFIGASIATVLSETFLYFIFLQYINKHYKKLRLYKYYIKPSIASLIMGLFTFYFREINLLLIILISILVYFTVLLFLKGFEENDRIVFKQVIGISK